MCAIDAPGHCQRFPTDDCLEFCSLEKQNDQIVQKLTDIFNTNFVNIKSFFKGTGEIHPIT